MSIIEAIKKVIAEDNKDFLKDKDLQELLAYYEKMKALGLVKKQEYTLPQLDTVGITCRHQSKDPS